MLKVLGAQIGTATSTSPTSPLLHQDRRVLWSGVCQLPGLTPHAPPPSHALGCPRSISPEWVHSLVAITTAEFEATDCTENPVNLNSIRKMGFGTSPRAETVRTNKPNVSKTSLDEPDSKAFLHRVCVASVDCKRPWIEIREAKPDPPLT